MGNLFDLINSVKEVSVLFKPEEYLDPGTGNIIIQILVASFVGIAFAFRSVWGKLFSKKKKSEDTSIDSESENE